MREIEIEINQEIEINTDGFGLKSEKYIVIFNHTNYYDTKFLSCLGGGGGRVKVGQNILTAFECYI